MRAGELAPSYAVSPPKPATNGAKTWRDLGIALLLFLLTVLLQIHTIIFGSRAQIFLYGRFSITRFESVELLTGTGVIRFRINSLPKPLADQNVKLGLAGATNAFEILPVYSPRHQGQQAVAVLK